MANPFDDFVDEPAPLAGINPFDEFVDEPVLSPGAVLVPDAFARIDQRRAEFNKAPVASETTPVRTTSVSEAFDAIEARRRPVYEQELSRSQDDLLASRFLEYRQRKTTNTPERQAEVFRAAAALRKMGQHPSLEFIDKDLDGYKKKIAAADVHWDEVLANHPRLKDYLLVNPRRQDLIADDMGHLDGLAWALQVPHMALTRAKTEQEFFARTFVEQKGLGSDDNRAAIEGLAPQVGESLYGAENLAAKVWAGTWNLAPMLLRYGAASAAGGWIGAKLSAPAAASAAGATGGVGGAIVAGGGVAAGAVMADAALSYYETVGPAYHRMVAQGVRPNIARNLAESEGVINGLIFSSAMPGLLTKLGLGGAGGAVAQGATEALQKRGYGQIVSETALQYGENVAHAAVLMSAAAGVSQATDEVARWVETGELSEGAAARIGQSITEAQMAAVRDMSLIAAFAPGRSALHNIGEAKRLADDQRQLEAAFKATENSKLLERAPDEFKTFIATLNQGGLKKVYSPVDAFNEYWQNRRANPREVAARLMGDDGAAYDRALQTGTDLALPVDNYLTVLGRTEHLRGLSQDLKIRADGKTPRQESARIERRAAEIAKIPDADERMKQGRRLLKDFFQRNIERTLVGNKIASPETVAEKTAEVDATVLHRMAEEINKNADEGTAPITAWDLFRQKARVEFEGKRGVRAGDIGAEAYADPDALAIIDQIQANQDDMGRLGAYYRDRNTGLLNEQGAELRAQDPSRPMTARFSLEGKKSANDLFGHKSVDGALRIMARALSESKIRDGVKRGGGIEADVMDQNHADALAAAMSKALDPSGRVKVFATATDRLGTTPETLGALGKLHDEREALEVAENRFADREGLPVGYKDVPGEFGPIADSWAQEASKDLEVAHADLIGAHAEHYSTMTPDQSAFETYRGEQGLLNELGYHLVEKNGGYTNFVSADVRNLKKKNAKMGRKNTDSVLRILSDTFARKGAGEINMAHLHGDEYAAASNDPGKMEDILDRVRESTDNMLMFGFNADTGRFFLQEGLHFVYGIDSTFDGADRRSLPEAKRRQGAVPEPRDFATESELRDAIRETQQRRRAEGGPEWSPISVVAGLLARDDSRAKGNGSPEHRRGPRGHNRASGAPDGRSGRAPEVAARGRDAGGTGAEASQGLGEGATRGGREDIDRGVQETLDGGAGAGSREGLPGVADERLQGDPAPSAGEAGPRGVASARKDSRQHLQAWSKWDAYQHILDTMGGVDASPSQYADGAYRRYLEESKRKGASPTRPPAFPGGYFDDINKELGRAPGKGVSSALEAFYELTKGLRWEKMQRAIDLLRTVPGMEKVRLPEEVENRIQAQRFRDEFTEHYRTAPLPEPKRPSDAERGSISFELPKTNGKARRYVINLDGADESTAAHETFHMLTEVLHDVATADNAPESIKRDYADLIQWMGHATPEERQAATRERIELARQGSKRKLSKEEQARLIDLEAKEERATYGWEEYLREGKAPSARLASAFARFGGWLAKIYRAGAPSEQFAETYGQTLGLTPEVKGIFDRLLASEDQLAATREAFEQQPLPHAREQMTEDERKEYDEATEKMQEETRLHVLRALATDQAERAAIVDEERAYLAEEAHKKLDRQPIYRALSFLQDRQIVVFDEANNRTREAPIPPWLLDEDGNAYRLDRKAIDAKYGKGAWHTLPAGTTVAKGGMAPNDLAMALGLKSGEEFIRGLQVVEPRQAFVDREVQAQLLERFGPALLDDPQKLFNEATAAIHNNAAAKRVMLEIRAMRRQLDPNIDPRLEVTSEKTRRELAKRLISETKIESLNPDTFQRAERAAARRAFEAASKGKFDQAVGERETQLLNQHLYREARKARDQADHIRTQLGKKSSDSYRAALGRAVRIEKQPGGMVVEHREYLDAHDAMLAAASIGGIEAPEDFQLGDLAARMDLEAADNVMDMAMLGAILADPRQYDELTLPEAVAIDEAVKNIRAASNAALEIIVGDKRQSIKSVVDRIRDDLEHRRPFLGKAPNVKDQVPLSKRAGLKVQAMDGAQLEPKLLLEMLGPGGVEIWDRYLDARGKRDELMERVIMKIKDAWDGVPAHVQKRMHEVIPELDKDLPIKASMNLEGPRDLGWLLGCFLNMGNKGSRSNAERLLTPFGWTEEQMLETIGKHMPVELAKFGQSVLDATDKGLWPDLAAKEQRKTGLEPGKIPASPITITFADGTTQTFAGGYYPARYKRDASAGDIAARQAEGTIQSFYGPGYERASTPKSHTKERAAGFSDVLDLDWSVAMNHLAQVSHDVAFDEFVRDTARVITHPELSPIIYQRVGGERSKQIDAWLKATANAFADSVPESMRWFSDLINPLRSATVTAKIGWSAKLFMGDMLNAGFSVAYGEIGPKNATAAYVKALAQAPAMLIGKSPMRNKALELSPELRRQANFNTDKIKHEVQNIGRKGNKILRGAERIRLTRMALQEASGAIVSTQIWWAAYNDAQDKGMAPAESVRWADDKVRNNFPSREPAEQPASIRDKRGMGAVLMFQGFQNKLYNMARREAEQASVVRQTAGGVQGQIRTALAVGRILAIPMVVLTAGEYAMSRGPTEGEESWEWWLRKSITGLISQVHFGGLLSPVVDLAVTGKVQPQSARIPGVSLVEEGLRMVGKLASEEREDEKKMWDAIELLLITTNTIPASQTRATGEYIMNLMDGDARPNNPLDAASGVMFGERRNQGSNPIRDLGKALE